MNGKIARWIASSKALSFPRKYAGRIIAAYYESKNVFFAAPKDASAIDLIRRLNSEIPMGISIPAAYEIYTIIRKLEKIDGEVAEVGVWKGGSARIICEATQKKVHLFDSFKGLPSPGPEDVPRQYYQGEFAVDFQEAEENLKKYSNVIFHSGFFPATADSLGAQKFSFVHLDVDLYQATLDGLNVFYPRLNPGGVIVSDDYNTAKGVKKAFDYFLRDKPEIVIEPLGTYQCMVVKSSRT